MKLMSMTDFVLEQERKLTTSDEIDMSYKFKNIVSYANFLKQPLTVINTKKN